MTDFLRAYRFERINQRKGAALTINDFLSAVTTDTPAKAAARDDARSADERREAKMQVPAWFFGGVLTDSEIKADNVWPDGVLNIDIDGVEPDRVELIKARLFALDSVFLAARSVSGRGVFALARVDLDTQAEAEKADEFYSLVEAVVLYDQAEGEHLDRACKDLARRRFESYDPAPLFDIEKASVERAYNSDFLSASRSAFSRSAVSKLASYFGSRNAPEPAGATTGCALALLNVAAGGRVAGRVLTEEYYKARMQAVVVGRSGAGKSTMRDALREAASVLNARTGIVESARALEVMLVQASLAEREGVEKKTPDRERFMQLEPPVPILAVYDEAGDEAQLRKTREHKAGIDAIRRRTFDKAFGAATSLNTQLPQIDFYCSYTDVQFTTPKSWARAKACADATVGDARRVLEFWTEDEPEPNAGGLDPVLARWAQRYTQIKPAADMDRINAFVAALSLDMPGPDREQIAVRLDGRDAHALENLQGVLALSRAGESEQAIEDHTTTVCNLASISAWAARHSRIEREDILTAWAVYLDVLANRRRLAEFAPLGPETTGAQISAAILDYLGEREVRYYTVKRMISRRGVEFTRALDALLADGVLTLTGSPKSRTIRKATDEELASREAARADREKSVFDGYTIEGPRPAQAAPAETRTATRPASKAYAECSTAEKLERLEKYKASFETKAKHMIIDGNADNALFILGSDLARAGMNDETAISWARAVCAEVGHVKKKDQDRVLRNMLSR